MKYRILLDAFTLRRDVMVNYVFARLLEKKGCSVKIACCRNFTTYLEHWKPHAVVVAVPGRIRVVRKHSPRSLIIFYPGEGGSPECSTYEKIYFTEGKIRSEYEQISRHYLWGDYNARIADKFLPQYKDKRTVAGDQRLDMVKFHPHLKERDNKLDSIGVIGRFSSINNFNGKPTIISLTNPDPRALSMVTNQCKQFYILAKLIRRIIKETDLKVSIRPHPLEAPEGYQEMLAEYPHGRVEIDDSLDYPGWLLSQKMVFSPASTSFLEAYLLEVPLVNVDRALQIEEVVKNNSVFASLAHQCSYQPDSEDELFDIIKSDIKPITNIAEINEHLNDVHNWNRVDSSLKFCVDDMLRYMRQSCPKINGSIFASTLSECIDWYKFAKSMYWGLRLHANFNYKSGYHGIPAYFEDIANRIALS